MAKRSKYTLSFAPEAIAHLDSIDAKHQTLLRRKINEQLAYTPLEETTNRKPMNQPAPVGAAWELRCGPSNRYRIFYEADEVEQVVSILAIGVKDRNRLSIGGEEFKS